ncbi:MAG: hypothetical protein ACI91J_003369, partial [Yoonia sp.]
LVARLTRCEPVAISFAKDIARRCDPLMHRVFTVGIGILTGLFHASADVRLPGFLGV